MGGVEASTTPAGDTQGLLQSLPTLAFERVPGREQDIIHTRSRQAKPSTWVPAVTWLIEAGLHPKHLHTRARATALRIVGDLAQRMDFSRGIVLYDLEGTAARLEMSVATVKRHVGYLRELGALVWLEHGSRRNLRLPGRAYTATATIYGAVIPPAYDAAHGHRLRGEGYDAVLIGRTPKGANQPVESPVDNTVLRIAESRLAPPSVGSYHPGPVADVSGKGQATRTARAGKSKPSKKSTLGHRVTAALFQAADRLARRLRPLHNWTQRAKISELSWVLVDKLAEGRTEQQIDAWLREISPAVAVGIDWRPSRPHAYIADQLLKERAERQADADLQAAWANTAAPNAEFGEAVQEVKARQATDGDEMPAVESLTDLDDDVRRALVSEAWMAFKYAGDPSFVLTAYEWLGPSAAAELFGQELVTRCLRLEASSTNPRIRVH
ncbi:hypothetical protein [Streptomyces filamentosus]|uniref:hypothetical protein n=1 Tax=Streptomyces filamentosus TaxID=67294 RepID=UPI0034040660